MIETPDLRRNREGTLGFQRSRPFFIAFALCFALGTGVLAQDEEIPIRLQEGFEYDDYEILPWRIADAPESDEDGTVPTPGMVVTGYVDASETLGCVLSVTADGVFVELLEKASGGGINYDVGDVLGWPFGEFFITACPPAAEGAAA